MRGCVCVCVMQEKARDMYRCKGVLAFVGIDEKYVFHGVHDQVIYVHVYLCIFVHLYRYVYVNAYARTYIYIHIYLRSTSSMSSTNRSFIYEC